jgi:hypothetical protein
MVVSIARIAPGPFLQLGSGARSFKKTGDRRIVATHWRPSLQAWRNTMSPDSTMCSLSCNAHEVLRSSLARSRLRSSTGVRRRSCRQAQADRKRKASPRLAVGGRNAGVCTQTAKVGVTRVVCVPAEDRPVTRRPRRLIRSVPGLAF